jgi:ribosomal protein S18 acetylase RimI-like enzyme
MKLKWIYEIDNINWDELSHLYKIAPFGDKKVQNLKTVFANSRYKCFVYDDAKIVGVGRALSDGVDASYISDVAIYPEYQGQGIGKAIVSKLVKFSKDYNKILLFTRVGKEPFYAKLGFDKMNTAMAIFKNQEQAFEVGLVSKMNKK